MNSTRNSFEDEINMHRDVHKGYKIKHSSEIGFDVMLRIQYFRPNRKPSRITKCSESV